MTIMMLNKGFFLYEKKEMTCLYEINPLNCDRIEGQIFARVNACEKGYTQIS